MALLKNEQTTQQYTTSNQKNYNAYPTSKWMSHLNLVTMTEVAASLCRDRITPHHVCLLLPPPLMFSLPNWLFPLPFPFLLIVLIIYLLWSSVPIEAKTAWASLLGNMLSVGKCLQTQNTHHGEGCLCSYKAEAINRR